MPCQHKFIEDLNLDRLDFKPETLIVGTFNPAWPANNQAEWFYGRTARNHFWDVLPRLYGEDSLIDETPADWKAFCKRHKIAITDLITSIDDAFENNPEHVTKMNSYSDKSIAEDFNEQVPNNIIALLQNHPTITNVYLTNGANGTFWRRKWNIIAVHANQNNIHAKKLMTPSSNARFGLAAHNRNNQNNQYINALLNDFILIKWSNEWHF
jgi:hypothetical protein